MHAPSTSTRRMLRWFIVLWLIVGVALLLRGVQWAFSWTGPASGDWGPAAASARDPIGVADQSRIARLRASPFTSATAWQSYPFFGGEMTSMAMGPLVSGAMGDAETVYVGTRDAGVFKTVDGGQSWRPARGGLTFAPIRTLVADPQDPSILYAGTDYDGIWRSMDGGDTWIRSSGGLDRGLIVFSIVVDPQDTDVLYAGLGGGVGLTIGNIYRSEDGGDTWELRDAGMPRSSETSTHTNAVFTMAIDPRDASRLYAGTNVDGAFVTSDGGEAWTAINDGLPFRPNSAEDRKPVNALATDPHHDHRLSAIIGGEYYIFEVGSWRKVSQGTYDVNTSIARAYLYFHPAISTTLYSAGDRFSKSTDGGVNWTQYLGWDDSGRVPEIGFHHHTPDTIYAATDLLERYWGGVYKSSDQGETWDEASQGITAVPVRSVAVDPQDDEGIYVGTGGGHVYRSENGGATWSRTYVRGSEVIDIAVSPQDSRSIYLASTYFNTSTDQGETFERVDEVEHPKCIAVAADGSAIYVGASFGRGIYKSEDGGATWEQKNEGLPTFGSSICPVLSIAVDPQDSDTAWAGMQYSGGIARTTDGGDHWHVKGLTETNFVEAIAVNPQDSDDILAGGGFWTGGIYRSIDGGDTWQQKISEIAFVQDILHDPRNPRWMYAATEGYGVLRSFDGGESWHDFSGGIFYPLLYALDVAGTEPPLLVTGSYGSGGYWRFPAAPEQVYLPMVVR